MDTIAVQQLLRDLHTVTGLSVHLYDSHRRGLIHYGKNQPLCNLIHTNADTSQLCHAFDDACFTQAATRGGVYAHVCPFGFYTAISPIYDAEKLIGYLQLDCALCNEDEAKRIAFDAALAYLPGGEVRIQEKLAQSNLVSAATLEATPSLMRAVCGYIEANSLFPLGDITLGLLAKRYIKHNLQSKLTLADIGANLHCSKATLTETFRREFGITIVQYINRVRLEKACNLLRNTDLPIHTVAEECGFSGAEYFSSLFKRALGTSPLAYRRQNAQTSGDRTNISL